MKYNCLILSVFVVSCVLLLQLGCQGQAGTSPESKTGSTKAESTAEVSEAAPEIAFEKVVHDFGEIGPVTKNVCEFKFTNTGQGLLKITKVSKTCGCTPYTLDKKEYEPGESGALKVRYNSSRRPGSITKKLFVSSNDKANPKVTLTVKARIVKRVDYKPKELSLLLDRDNAGCLAITLSSLDGKSFSIKRFKSTANCITADVNSSVKATEFVLEPRVDMEKLQKNLKGRIDIGLTHPECDLVTVRFNTLPEFEINPSTLVVLGAEPLKPVTKKLWVLNNYNEDFEVESASSQKGIIKVLSQEKFGNRYKFELEIIPPPAEDKRRFTDVFYVKIKGGERLKVNCRGFYSVK